MEGQVHLMDDTVPGVAGIIYDDVDLAIAKLGGLFDQSFKVCIV